MHTLSLPHTLYRHLSRVGLLAIVLLWCGCPGGPVQLENHQILRLEGLRGEAVETELVWYLQVESDHHDHVIESLGMLASDRVENLLELIVEHPDVGSDERALAREALTRVQARQVEVHEDGEALAQAREDYLESLTALAVNTDESPRDRTIALTEMAYLGDSAEEPLADALIAWYRDTDADTTYLEWAFGLAYRMQSIHGLRAMTGMTGDLGYWLEEMPYIFDWAQSRNFAETPPPHDVAIEEWQGDPAEGSPEDAPPETPPGSFPAPPPVVEAYPERLVHSFPDTMYAYLMAQREDVATHLGASLLLSHGGEAAALDIAEMWWSWESRRYRRRAIQAVENVRHARSQALAMDALQHSRDVGTLESALALADTTYTLRPDAVADAPPLQTRPAQAPNRRDPESLLPFVSPFRRVIFSRLLDWPEDVTHEAMRLLARRQETGPHRVYNQLIMATDHRPTRELAIGLRFDNYDPRADDRELLAWLREEEGHESVRALLLYDLLWTHRTTWNGDRRIVAQVRGLLYEGTADGWNAPDWAGGGRLGWSNEPPTSTDDPLPWHLASIELGPGQRHPTYSQSVSFYALAALTHWGNVHDAIWLETLRRDEGEDATLPEANLASYQEALMWKSLPQMLGMVDCFDALSDEGRAVMLRFSYLLTHRPRVSLLEQALRRDRPAEDWIEDLPHVQPHFANNVHGFVRMMLSRLTDRDEDIALAAVQRLLQPWLMWDHSPVSDPPDLWSNALTRQEHTIAADGTEYLREPLRPYLYGHPYFPYEPHVTGPFNDPAMLVTVANAFVTAVQHDLDDEVVTAIADAARQFCDALHRAVLVQALLRQDDAPDRAVVALLRSLPLPLNEEVVARLHEPDIVYEEAIAIHGLPDDQPVHPYQREAYQVQWREMFFTTLDRALDSERDAVRTVVGEVLFQNRPPAGSVTLNSAVPIWGQPGHVGIHRTFGLSAPVAGLIDRMLADEEARVIAAAWNGLRGAARELPWAQAGSRPYILGKIDTWAVGDARERLLAASLLHDTWQTSARLRGLGVDGFGEDETDAQTVSLTEEVIRRCLAMALDPANESLRGVQRTLTGILVTLPDVGDDRRQAYQSLLMRNLSRGDTYILLHTCRALEPDPLLVAQLADAMEIVHRTAAFPEVGRLFVQSVLLKEDLPAWFAFIDAFGEDEMVDDGHGQVVLGLTEWNALLTSREETLGDASAFEHELLDLLGRRGEESFPYILPHLERVVSNASLPFIRRILDGDDTPELPRVIALLGTLMPSVDAEVILLDLLRDLEGTPFRNVLAILQTDGSDAALIAMQDAFTQSLSSRDRAALEQAYYALQERIWTDLSPERRLQVLDRFIRTLEDEDDTDAAVIRAIRALAAVPHDRRASLLVDYLEFDEPRIQAVVVEELVGLLGAEAVPYLEPLLDDAEDEVLDALLTVVSRYPGPVMNAFLLRIATDDDYDLSRRQRALQDLKNTLSDEEKRALALDLLDDDERSMRLEGLRMLKASPYRTLPAVLLEVIADDDSDEEVREALSGLQTLVGNPQAYSIDRERVGRVCLRLLCDSGQETPIRVSAAEILTAVQHAPARAVLQEIARDNSEELQLQARCQDLLDAWSE